MNLVQSVVVRGLRSAGFRVFAPPVAPVVDSVWRPGRTGAAIRQVTGLPPGCVAYHADGRDGLVSLDGWHRWQRRTQAIARAR